MAGFTNVAKTTDIPLGGMRAFEIGFDSIVICHTKGGFFAVADECSHNSAPIRDGHLDGEEIVCCRHGGRFKVLDGSVTGPPALVGIDHYELKIDGDDILVKIY